MSALCLHIPGAPRTKKNHGTVIQRGRRRFHVPSDAWTAWATAAAFAIAPTVRRHAPRLPFPPAVQLNCAALFFRHARVGDAVGYYQGLADLLERAGVVENDVSIVSWDGSRLLKDAQRPRVELVLTVLS